MHMLMCTIDLFVEVSMNTYNLFISHSWKYSDAYEELVNLLDARPYFYYRNYSVPFNDPINDANNDRQLKEAIWNQMLPASCILVLAGVYSTYSKWINIEVKMAKTEFYKPKPVIAIEPWGAERTSIFVKQNADEIVKWQTESIVDAIRRFSI